MSAKSPNTRHATAPDLAELYRRYRAELLSYVARTFGSGPPEPEDLVQAAFARYAALADAAAVLNPRAFLYRTVHNAAVEQLRRDATRSKANERFVAPWAQTTDDLDGERVLMAKERYRILEQVIRGMEAERQRVLIMHRIHELSFAEIARRTGISQTQVKRLAAAAVLECNAALKRAFKGVES